MAEIDDARIEGKLEVARRLLTSGVSLDLIVQSTGPSPDKIQTLGN
jgi:hypothetical protein